MQARHRPSPFRRKPPAVPRNMLDLLLKATLVATLALAVPTAPVSAQGHDHAAGARPPEPTEVSLISGLGDHHVSIRTSSPRAQQYFDQGMRLYYAFNHSEAVRSFREAQRLDPDCAMCWWGEALTWGPNINMPMDSAGAVAAWVALQEARERRAHASPREQALIDALSERYAGDAPEARAHLDSAYTRAMAEVVRRFPSDHEAAVLYGESIMDLQPWDYWAEDAKPRPGISDALSRFEGVLASNPDHPGACHFYIHAVEKEHPDLAVPCAERLAGLMPGAGHIVHMPGHIYIRVGRYADAIETNKHAVHADESYIQDVRPGVSVYTAGYYPHNYDFLAFAASMIGRSEEALGAARQMKELVPEEMFGVAGMDFLQHWATRPLQMQIRFGRWQEILATERPRDDLPHARGMWHYARGRARAATGDFRGALDDLDALRATARTPGLEGVRMEFNQSRDILAIAAAVLEGWIAAERGDHADAVAALREGVRLEDALLYGEPPEWSIPVRLDLGTVLLEAGRFDEAEAAFRENLDHFPDNGWGLHGLARALEGQGRGQEAREVTERFRAVWAEADVEPEVGRS